MSIRKKRAQELLRTFHQRRGYTQQSLADVIGVTRSTVGRWETVEEPSAYYLGELARLADKEGEGDLAIEFRKLQLERNRISQQSWQLTYNAVVELSQIIAHHKAITDQKLWNQVESPLNLLIESLYGEDATSEPDSDQKVAAQRAIERLTELRSQAALYKKPSTDNERS